MTLRQKLLLLTMGAVFAFSVFGGSSGKHTNDEAKAKATVMITNLAERSGGTGVVLSSSSTGSTVLTNAHVCGLAKSGAVVKSGWKRGFVSSYKVSQIHDLCLIETSTDFGTQTSIASNPPRVSSQAAVSGHPRLAPVIVTRGSFGNHQLVTVMTGVRPCTEDDVTKDPLNGIICSFLGGFPIIRTYEAQFIGATIQAGNSGSAVYNEQGEIAGLVFAGSGDLSYAEIVPQEYVYNFIKYEAKTLEAQKPNTEIILDATSMTGSNRLHTACMRIAMGDNMLAPISKYCNMVNTDLIYTK